MESADAPSAEEEKWPHDGYEELNGAASSAAPRLTGVCERYDELRGFGFIARDDRKPSIFVHQEELLMDGFRKLAPGQLVSFAEREGERLQAVSVRLLNAPASKPAKMRSAASLVPRAVAARRPAKAAPTSSAARVAAAVEGRDWQQPLPRAAAKAAATAAPVAAPPPAPVPPPAEVVAAEPVATATEPAAAEPAAAEPAAAEPAAAEPAATEPAAAAEPVAAAPAAAPADAAPPAEAPAEAPAVAGSDSGEPEAAGGKRKRKGGAKRRREKRAWEAVSGRPWREDSVS